MIRPVVLTMPSLKRSHVEHATGQYAGADAVLAHDLVPVEQRRSGATRRHPESVCSHRCSGSDGELMFEVIASNPVQVPSPHRYPDGRSSVGLLAPMHQLKGVTDGTE